MLNDLRAWKYTWDSIGVVEQYHDLYLRSSDRSRILYELRRDRIPELSDAANAVDKTFTDFVDKHTEADDDGDGGKVIDINAAKSAALMSAHSLCGEVFARLMGETESIEGYDGPAWPRKVHQSLDASASFRRLSEVIGNDAELAAVAAGAILEGINSTLPQLLEDEDSEGESDGRGDGDRKDDGDGGDPVEVPPELVEAIISAVKEAARAVQALAGEMKRAGLGSGAGNRSVDHAFSNPLPRRYEIAKILSKSKRAQSVIDRAGRMVRFSVADRVERSEDGEAEVVGIELGGNIAQLTPYALATTFGDDTPDMVRLLALRDVVLDLSEQHQYAGAERLARGPVVMCVDASGSMSGNAIDVAMAMAISTLRMCVRERRPLHLCTFDHRILDGWSVGRYGAVRHAAGGCMSEATPWGDIMDMVAVLAGYPSCGGTSFSDATAWALERVAKEPNADIIMLTDGDARISADQLQQLNALKATGTRLYSVLMPGGRVSESIKNMSNHIIDWTNGYNDSDTASVRI